MWLYLVRHGETAWNAQRRAQGQSDIPLNETGRRQAEALALALAREPFAAVYSSPLQRAYDTAAAIAGPHKLAVQMHPALKELDQGELDGLLPEEMREHYGSVLRRWNAGDTSMRLPGGESMQDLQDRGWAAVQELRARHPSDTVLVVSHNLAILAILCKALGLPLESFRRLRQSTGALHVLEIGPTRTMLLRFNDVCHSRVSNTE